MSLVPSYLCNACGYTFLWPGRQSSVLPVCAICGWDMTYVKPPPPMERQNAEGDLRRYFKPLLKKDN